MTQKEKEERRRLIKKYRKDPTSLTRREKRRFRLLNYYSITDEVADRVLLPKKEVRGLINVFLNCANSLLRRRLELIFPTICTFEFKEDKLKVKLSNTLFDEVELYEILRNKKLPRARKSKNKTSQRTKRNSRKK